jgi:preprotein translocase subunit SecF
MDLKAGLDTDLSNTFGETFRIIDANALDNPGYLSYRVRFDRAHSLKDIQNALQYSFLKGAIIEEKGEVQEYQYLIRVQKTDLKLKDLGEKMRQDLIREFGQGEVLSLEELGEKVNQTLGLEFGKGLEIRQVEMVGPKVGKELGQKASFAILFAILFIAIYISGRFEFKWLMSFIMAVSLALVVYIASSFGLSIILLSIVALIATIVLCWALKLKYAMGAILALIHDVTITIGAFALTNREISLPIIAAFLTIIGYSLNDTIVVFDRIRENLKRFRRKSFPDIINASINETLSRTILTSMTTLVVIVILYIFGVNITYDFCFAILIGILVGTYSSIFVASPILLILEDRPVLKE